MLKHEKKKKIAMLKTKRKSKQVYVRCANLCDIVYIPVYLIIVIVIFPLSNDVKSKLCIFLCFSMRII